MKHLKLFESDLDYTIARESNTLNKPSVSYVPESRNVYYDDLPKKSDYYHLIVAQNGNLPNVIVTLEDYLSDGDERKILGLLLDLQTNTTLLYYAPIHIFDPEIIGNDGAMWKAAASDTVIDANGTKLYEYRLPEDIATGTGYDIFNSLKDTFTYDTLLMYSDMFNGNGWQNEVYPCSAAEFEKYFITDGPQKTKLANTINILYFNGQGLTSWTETEMLQRWLKDKTGYPIAFTTIICSTPYYTEESVGTFGDCFNICYDFGWDQSANPDTAFGPYITGSSWEKGGSADTRLIEDPEYINRVFSGNRYPAYVLFSNTPDSLKYTTAS